MSVYDGCLYLADHQNYLRCIKNHELPHIQELPETFYMNLLGGVGGDLFLGIGSLKNSIPRVENLCVYVCVCVFVFCSQ